MVWLVWRMQMMTDGAAMLVVAVVVVDGNGG